MNRRPAMSRARLVEIPAGTELLRAVRFLQAADLEDCSTDELTNAARWLRAASYSASEGARRVEAIIRERTKDTTTCESPSTPTVAPTSSAESPTDTPPTAGPS